MKDFLDSRGVVLETVTPASVIRAAFAARLIADGDVWMRALEARNRMAHTYDVQTFEKVVCEIEVEYLAAMESLRLFLRQEVARA